MWCRRTTELAKEISSAQNVRVYPSGTGSTTACYYSVVIVDDI